MIRFELSVTKVTLFSRDLTKVWGSRNGIGAGNA